MIVILLEDIYSNKGEKLYGKKGEKVTVIAVHDEVLIVEGSKERFSVHKSKTKQT